MQSNRVVDGHRSRIRGKESATLVPEAQDRRNERRKKCILYIVLFVVFQSAVITLFILTVMRIRTPKFSLMSAAFKNFNLENTTSSMSFNASINIEFAVKNANFGRFKYGNTKFHLMYRGTQVGQVAVAAGLAKWRSTATFTGLGLLDFSGVKWDSRLASDMNSGVLPVTGHGKARGTVNLLFVMKKNKWGRMNCTMEISSATQELRNIVCR